MIWFGKSFIKFCKSFINLMKLVCTRTCSSARIRAQTKDVCVSIVSYLDPCAKFIAIYKLPTKFHWRTGRLQLPSHHMILCRCRRNHAAAWPAWSPSGTAWSPAGFHDSFLVILQYAFEEARCCALAVAALAATHPGTNRNLNRRSSAGPR